MDITLLAGNTFRDCFLEHLYGPVQFALAERNKGEPDITKFASGIQLQVPGESFPGLCKPVLHDIKMAQVEVGRGESRPQ